MKDSINVFNYEMHFNHPRNVTRRDRLSARVDVCFIQTAIHCFDVSRSLRTLGRHFQRAILACLYNIFSLVSLMCASLSLFVTKRREQARARERENCVYVYLASRPVYTCAV